MYVYMNNNVLNAKNFGGVKFGEFVKCCIIHQNFPTSA